MDRRTTRHLATFIFLLTAPCLAKHNETRHNDSDMLDDRKVSKNHELKIFTNDKRMSVGDLDDSTPVTLSVYFMLTSPFEVLEFRLPPGFRVVPDPKLGCGVYSLGESADDSSEASDAKEFSKSVHAKHLTPFIDHCHVYESQEKKLGKHGDEMTQVHVRISLKHDVAGLSQDVAVVKDGAPDETKRGWWSFALHVRNPLINPTDEDNQFALFHFHRTDVWNGDIYLRGWPIYGDWGCKYSDWSGWGQCSARCGGGTLRLTRRLLLEPPPHRGTVFGKPCADPLEKIVPCNDYACKFPCQLVDVGESGVCSAECGGGIRAQRWRWKGDGCPAKDDLETVQFETCNTEPCKARCILADTWTVVTGCSEMCGQGTYRMMREVLQKDQNDPACQPEWREVKCARQWCTQLSIIRPDRNILPYPGDTYYVGLAFKLTFAVQKVTLSAPAGYSFGTPGADCHLHDHDLSPYYKGCKVGIRSVDGSWLDSRSITILLNAVLPRSDAGRYNFMLPVTNPHCPRNDFRQLVTIGDQPGPKEVCVIPYDQNLWEMQLVKETVAVGHTPMSLWAAGYELHNPQESRKLSIPGGKDLFWATTNDAHFVSLEQNAWRARVVYCSPRLEPCPDGSPCPASGVCPTADDGNGDIMDQGSWTLDDSTQVTNVEDPATTVEASELEGPDDA